jgi:hypothetical protein
MKITSSVSRPSLLFAAAIAVSLGIAGSPAVARSTSGTGANLGTSSATTHMSAQGMANTNGPSASDRDTGLDRAKDRMSAQGLAHNHALKKHHSDNDADDRTTTTTTTSTNRR